MKKVLMTEFGDIMERVMENSEHTKYIVEFPKTTDRGRSNSIRKPRMPQSIIAANTKEHLKQSGKKENIDAIEIGNEIIDGFVEIYDKYASNSANLMININSTQRDALEDMFEKDENNNIPIKIEYKQHVENSPDANKNDLLEWLLTKLIETTEAAVEEVSFLMNDSYTRYKRDNNTYKKAVKLAMERMPSVSREVSQQG